MPANLSSSLPGRVAALLLLLFFAGVPAGAQAKPKTLHDGKLTVCLFPNFQPFVGKKDGVWSGWDYDYLQAFAKEQGLKLEVYESKDFDGIWNLPGKDQCDIAGSGISDLLKRRQESGDKGIWSNTYYYVQRSFAVLGDSKLASLDDLAGKKVIITENSTADLDLRNRIKCSGRPASDFDIKPGDENTAIGQVADATIFAYGGGYGSILELIKGTQMKAAWTHDFMNADCQEVAEPFSFVVRAASTGLIQAFNKFVCAGAGYPGNQPSAAKKRR